MKSEKNPKVKIGSLEEEVDFDTVYKDIEEEQARKLKSLNDKLAKIVDRLNQLSNDERLNLNDLDSLPPWCANIIQLKEETKKDIDLLKEKIAKTAETKESEDWPEWYLGYNLHQHTALRHPSGEQKPPITEQPEPTRMQKGLPISLNKEEKKENLMIYNRWLEAPNTTKPLDTLIGKVNEHVYEKWGPYLGTGSTVFLKIILLRLKDTALSCLYTPRSIDDFYQLVELLQIILRYRKDPENQANLDNTEHFISELEARINPLGAKISESQSKIQQFINDFKELSGLGTVNQSGIRTVFFPAPVTGPDDPREDDAQAEDEDDGVALLGMRKRI